MKIVIAGASGFIGGLLLDSLKSSHELIALGRSKSVAGGAPKLGEVEWRSCDLFSLLQTESGVQGAELGIYLVHSMLPRARLTQSTFEDCDLLLADNFARAAHQAGIKRILYLSGLIPEGSALSKHLESRREVERALSSRGLQVTTLRSGLILGSQGSSFQAIYEPERELSKLMLLSPGDTVEPYAADYELKSVQINLCTCRPELKVKAAGL